MTPDLQTLADMPGAGKAAEALRKAGCWDETAGGTVACEWRVRVTARVLSEMYVTVTARSARDALARAQDKAALASAFDWQEIETQDATADLPDAPIGPADEGDLT